jgi:hypothetical protein
MTQWTWLKVFEQEEQGMEIKKMNKLEEERRASGLREIEEGERKEIEEKGKREIERR